MSEPKEKAEVAVDAMLHELSRDRIMDLLEHYRCSYNLGDDNRALTLSEALSGEEDENDSRGRLEVSMLATYLATHVVSSREKGGDEQGKVRCHYCGSRNPTFHEGRCPQCPGIILNGFLVHPRLEEGEISYGSVVQLADIPVWRNPTVTYRKHGLSGILTPGQSIRVSEGMVFNVAVTG